MACGDRYRHLAVTSSGNSFDNPYDDVATAADFEEWVGLAEKLERLANAHLAQLAYIECSRNAGTNCGTDEAQSPVWTKWNALIPLQNELRGQIEDLNGFFNTIGNLSYHEPIEEAMAAAASALCLLEQSDDALVGYGAVPPAIPGVWPKPTSNSDFPWWGWALLGAGGVITLGALSYMLVKSKRSKALPSRPSASASTASANPEAFFSFKGRDKKRYRWSRSELDDTILESEAWDKPSLVKKIDRLKPGQSITVDGETLKRLGSTKKRAA